ncbi:MAG TPA: hypothetical protein DIW47_14460 [Bacteroidetes bacterium]|nr:hypothetical protein [Bacteroidota bacterium]
MKTGLSRRNFLPDWSRDFFDTDNFFDGDLERLPFFKNRHGLPSVNITENENEFLIDMAVPGRERKDFQIEVDDHTLSIRSEKEEEKEAKKKNYLRREYFHSSFERTFTLPENCNSEHVEAKYENGILKIAIEKKTKAAAKAPKTIKID